MLKYIMVLLAGAMMFANAAEVEYEIKPEKPVVGTEFNLIFYISTIEGRSVYIAFDPAGVEVLSREKVVLSSKSKLIGGRIETVKKYSYVYRLYAERPGLARISDISIEIDGKERRISNISLKVFAKKRKPPGVFIEAIPDKKKVYLGEGLNVSYYLFFNPGISVNVRDVVKFPKLNNFIKRYHKATIVEENVLYDGFRLKRSEQYEARIYPRKTGEIKIDPLKLKIVYAGSGRKRMWRSGGSSRNIQSKTISLSVLPTPEEGRPRDFGGLIGKHEFKIIVSQTHYKVNEPIEVKLVMEGPGELESFLGPRLYRNDDLEEFDIRSEIIEIGRKSARKIFEYTFLARKSMQLGKEQIEISWFDPKNEKYEVSKLMVPGIIVSGGTGTLKEDKTDKSTMVQKTTTEKFKKADLMSPVFVEYAKRIPWLLIINTILGFLIIFIILKQLIKLFQKTGNYDEYMDLKNDIEKSGPTYSKLHKLIMYINHTGSKNSSISDIVLSTKLTEEAKKYFQEVITLSEKNSFDKDAEITSFTYRKEYFKELINEIKRSQIDEDYKESGGDHK
ncbi:MAG: BatD family protein [Bacteriovoracaceae bacterium]|nr:BatD family protein [Bacteriovoracaceae bacterium]